MIKEGPHIFNVSFYDTSLQLQSFRSTNAQFSPLTETSDYMNRIICRKFICLHLRLKPSSIDKNE